MQQAGDASRVLRGHRGAVFASDITLHINQEGTVMVKTKDSMLPDVTQQPIIHVDATPDAEYALRILKAYRENCNCKWASDPENALIKFMNETNDERARILDKAIKTLEKWYGTD